MLTDNIVAVSPGGGLDREGSYTVACNYRTLHSNNNKNRRGRMGAGKKCPHTDAPSTATLESKSKFFTV
jgi:hypothetical protein